MQKSESTNYMKQEDARNRENKDNSTNYYIIFVILLLLLLLFLRLTSTKPQAEILKLNNVNGCNDISFGDHSILEGDRIPR